MTKEQFKVIAKGMKAVYTNDSFLPDNDAFNVWYSLLKDLDYEQCAVAVQIYMSTEKYPPTIADIRAKASKKADTLTDMEAWSKVSSAIRDSTYHAEERFNELPAEIQRAIGTPNQLRNWAMDSNYNEGVVQSNFLRAYNKVKATNDELNRLPVTLQTLITGTTQKMIGESL